MTINEIIKSTEHSKKYQVYVQVWMYINLILKLFIYLSDGLGEQLVEHLSLKEHPAHLPILLLLTNR